VALQSILGSMFTYPGRIVGLPGKSQIVRNQIGVFLKTGGADYAQRVRTEDLTPLQRKWVQVLANPNVTQRQLDELYTTPSPTEFSGYTLPPTNLPKPVKVLTRTEVSQMKQSTTSAPHGKTKALPIPAQGQQL
jgi:hypothetical protein